MLFLSKLQNIEIFNLWVGEEGGEDGGGRTVGPAFSARRPLTVWSSTWVARRGSTLQKLIVDVGSP